ncbi:MAG: AI-2E family transporter [Sphaerochaetaceae bacterium]|nr:AI-2E family transporter [Sphaerochaetaceae bacterium]
MEEKTLRQIRNVLGVILTIAVMAVFRVTASVSVTLVMSLFLFVLMIPFVTALEKMHFPSWLATLVAVLLMAAILTVAVFFLLYTVSVMLNMLPFYGQRINELDNLISGFLSRMFAPIPENYSILAMLDVDWVGSMLIPMLRTVSGSVVGILRSTVITLLLSVFLLVERHTLAPKLVQTVKEENQVKVASVLERINRQVSRYLMLKVFISILTGLCFYVTGLAVGLDFSLILGVLAVIMNFIPTFGSIIVTGLFIFVAMLQFLPNITPILIVALCGTMTQMILGNVIEPRLQGTQLNISPFVILVGLSVFGYVWGIVGMFLAVPCLSIIQIIFANIESTKGIAMVISSGSSWRRKMKNERKKTSQPGLFDDILMPEKPDSEKTEKN